MKEAGVPDFDIYTWFGLMVPGSTPDDIVDELNAAIVPVLRDPATVKKFQALAHCLRLTRRPNFPPWLSVRPKSTRCS